MGLQQWSDDDQALAKAFQGLMKVPPRGLPLKVSPLRAPRAQPQGDAEEFNAPVPTGGGSDDMGDISWSVPTVVLGYPSNIQGGPGHNWANAISMATPIAHKGVVAGAKVQAMTILDTLLNPALVQHAWEYFNNVQTKEVKYKSFLRPDDQPPIWLNQKPMEQYRPKMKPLYYDPSKHDTYMEQLGIKYPTLQPPPTVEVLALIPRRKMKKAAGFGPAAMWIGRVMLPANSVEAFTRVVLRRLDLNDLLLAGGRDEPAHAVSLQVGRLHDLGERRTLGAGDHLQYFRLMLSARGAAALRSGLATLAFARPLGAFLRRGGLLPRLALGGRGVGATCATGGLFWLPSSRALFPFVR